MVNWKNTIENIILIIVMFVGLGVYTSLVLKPIIVEAIRTENTKIETNIKTDIDNKFKKIDELNAKLPFSIPVESNQSVGKECFLTIDQYNSLRDSRKRTLKRWLGN